MAPFKAFLYIKKRAQEFLLNRQLSKTKSTSKEFLKLDKANKVAILYDIDNQADNNLINDFKHELGHQVELLGYTSLKTKENPSNNTLRIFSQEDWDWFLNPKSDVLSNFINKEYDVLFNLYFSDCLPLQIASTKIKAKFKVGCYHKNNVPFNDFLIDIEKNKTMAHLVEQIKNYL